MFDFRRMFRWRTKLQQGNRLHAEHRYEEALKAYLAHARDCPADAADAYAKAAKTCRSINTLTSPMKIADGVKLVFQGDRKTAQLLFEKALSIDPNHFESLIGISELLPEKSEERLEVMQRAVHIQPHYLTLIKIGDFFLRVRSDYAMAFEAYQEALEHHPRDGTAYSRLAKICRKLGRDEEAKGWRRRWQEVYAKKRQVGPSGTGRPR